MTLSEGPAGVVDVAGAALEAAVVVAALGFAVLGALVYVGVYCWVGGAVKVVGALVVVVSGGGGAAVVGLAVGALGGAGGAGAGVDVAGLGCSF
jgi:hypothetical protein